MTRSKPVRTLSWRAASRASSVMPRVLRMRSEHQADELAGIDAGLDDAGLGLDDEIGAGEMDREIERRLAGLELDAEHALDRIRAR